MDQGALRMTRTVKGALALLLVLALCGSHFWAYNKGKDSIIKGVIAGVSTTQVKDSDKAKKDVAQAEADTQKITQLTAQRDEALKKLKEHYTQNPPSPTCRLSDFELRTLQAAAGRPAQP